MPKLVTVNVDDLSGDFTIDNTGFHGKGCADIVKILSVIGTITKETKKPEYNEKNTTLVRK